MPSLAAVISAIVGGCVLMTLLLSYTIWPKPTRLRTPPLLYKTCPFSEEVRIAFPPSLNEDVASSRFTSPQGRVVRPNPKQYGLWGSIVFHSGVIAGHRLSFGKGQG
ncbi:hypothetical protein OBBRIDRAFT_808551 [Obba rivulosa]|uniref:Uncharacterized protein n=1 Tax=Obba rivulosa TaxID=1052685 RepID=A0A8E2DFP5_9APHY|nr:hypothetical protein OBBRIDRAFT_808551 [Obba rivulosa]